MSVAPSEADPGLSKPEEPFGSPDNGGEDEPWPGPHEDEGAGPEVEPAPDTEGTNAPPRPQRHYPPRTCRICLETILPTYEAAQGGIAAMLDPTPRVSYVSLDPQAGRLIRPCKCKGSSRYVHEGCLQAWRHADRRYSRRTFWECPTCGFRYKLERMRYARWISSTFTQILLTLVIMFIAIFIFGFIADPIIELVLGPIEPLEEVPEELQDIYDRPWTLHFIKGMASIGLIGFARVLTLPPFLWNMQSAGGVRVGGRRGGRDRVGNVTLTVILTGLITIMIVGGQFCYMRSMLTDFYRLCGNGFGFGAGVG
jgi:RING-variant domain